MSSRDELVYMAKLAQEAERFHEMVNYMREVVQYGQELSIEERNLFSIAYKNSVNSRRTSLRYLQIIECREVEKDNDSYSQNLVFIRNYKTKVEDELNFYCIDILNLIEKHLIKSATTFEAKAFYLIIKGDYLKYISEYSKGDYKLKAVELAAAAYQTASEIIKELQTTNPITLQFALNYSQFCYEEMGDPEKAQELLKNAHSDAISNIDKIQEDEYNDTVKILQLIRDNLMQRTDIECD